MSANGPGKTATLGILVYNQEAFVREAIEGALAQNYTPLQIIISDDCSPDGSARVIEQVVSAYTGVHQVVVNRNSKNLALAGNVNRVLELAHGEIVLLAGGDDISLPTRVSRAMEVIEAHPGVASASFETMSFGGYDRPSPHARAAGLLKFFQWENYIANPSFHLNGAARAFRREVFTYFGPISPDCPTEDSVILLRSLLLGDAVEVGEAQVLYRIHQDNLSAPDSKYSMDYHALFQQYVADIRCAHMGGRIATAEMDQLVAALGVRTKRSVLRSGLQRVRFPLAYFVRHILFSRAFTAKQRKRMLRKVVRRRLSKR